MIFPKRVSRLDQTTGITLGSQVIKEITRDFHIESIFLKVTAVGSGNIATATADGLFGLLKNARVTVSDASRTRNVVDVSGRGLLEYFMQINGGLDLATWACKDITTLSGVTFVMTYPIFFAHPQLSDPVGSALLLPAPRFNQNIQLTCNFATQADLDSNATPTAAFSSIKLDVIVNRREVNVTGFPSLDTELVELQKDFSTSGSNQLYELQIPGSYSGILFRHYASATSRASIATSGGEVRVESLGNQIRRTTFADMEIENQMSCYPQAAGTSGAGTLFAASYYWDFLTDKIGQDASDLGSTLDTNVLANIGAKASIYMDVGGSGNFIKFLTHRIYGDLSIAKFPFQKKAA